MQPFESDQSRLTATLRELRAAALYLIGRRPGRAEDLAEVARGGAFFPVLGLVLGAVVAAVAWAIERWMGAASGSLVALVGLAAASRGTQPLALARAVADLGSDAPASGMPGSDTTASAQPGRPTPAASVAGFLTLAITSLLKLAAIALVPDGARPLAIALAAMLGRWAFVVEAYGSQSAAGDRASAFFAREMKFREFGNASVSAMALTLILADAFGLVLLLGVAVQTIVLRIVVHRRWGGVTEASLGAAAELGETSMLLLAAGLARLLAGV